MLEREAGGGNWGGYGRRERKSADQQQVTKGLKKGESRSGRNEERRHDR